jgi:hypothetical protein
MTKLRDSQRGSSDAGSVIGIVILLAVLGWIAAVLGLPHINTTNQEALSHRDAMYQITTELGLHRTAEETILVPKFDGSLDIFVNRAAFESVPYPDRDELAAAISDIWCNQVSSFLLPAVHFRDVQTGSTLVTRGCLFQSSPEIAGNYSGTVHNITANMDSTFEVQLVKTTNGVKGCMQVTLPLVGTGPVGGTLNDRNLIVDLTAPDVRIRFEGTRIGHSITGHYTVTSNGQAGTFTLHQDVPRMKIGFDPNNCPR